LLLAIWYTDFNFNSAKRTDADCIEWAVKVTYPNKTEAWAIMPYDPRNKEEAEQIAKQLESQDRGGRNYRAECKKYR
jgi:hypothetical protein